MTYTTPYPDTLFIGATDLQSLDGVVFNDISGLLEEGPLRGNNDTIPRRPGEIGAELVPDAFDFSLEVTVLTDESETNPIKRRGIMIARYNALKTACRGTNGLATYTRRLSNAAGSYDATTCNGQCKTEFAPPALNLETVKLLLTFRNLDGVWA